VTPTTFVEREARFAPTSRWPARPSVITPTKNLSLLMNPPVETARHVLLGLPPNRADPGCAATTVTPPFAAALTRISFNQAEIDQRPPPSVSVSSPVKFCCRPARARRILETTRLRLPYAERRAPPRDVVLQICS